MKAGKNAKTFNARLLQAAHGVSGSPLTFDALYPYIVENNKDAKVAAQRIGRYAKLHRGELVNWAEVRQVAILAGWGFIQPDYLPRELNRRKRIDPHLGNAASRIKQALSEVRNTPGSAITAQTRASIEESLSSALRTIDTCRPSKNSLLEIFARMHRTRTGKELPLSAPAHRPRDNSPEARMALFLCLYFRGVSSGKSPAHKIVSGIVNAAWDVDGAFTEEWTREIERRHSSVATNPSSALSFLRGR